MDENIYKWQLELDGDINEWQIEMETSINGREEPWKQIFVGMIRIVVFYRILC